MPSPPCLAGESVRSPERGNTSDCISFLDRIEKIRAIEERGSVLKDEVLYAATLRHLQTLAEASQQLPDSHKADEPAIPWRDISGFRNILVHNYLGEIDPLTIQAVTREHLPRLELAVRRILEKHEE